MDVSSNSMNVAIVTVRATTQGLMMGSAVEFRTAVATAVARGNLLYVQRDHMVAFCI
jgi:hypothetical protein